ncbi:MAG: aminotransferase class V-fold PLP-dependent enzyme, partial [Ruminococcaceae bacterium]|nr:aminotransferase class V-fold PLP-dependent enzyme [Oscillospiraceae bacterium]
MIYLDNAATTFPKPDCVYSTVDFIQRSSAVNVGRGSYQVATNAMKIVDETRILMAELLNIQNPDNIVFAPSATIAAN